MELVTDTHSKATTRQAETPAAAAEAAAAEAEAAAAASNAAAAALDVAAAAAAAEAETMNGQILIPACTSHTQTYAAAAVAAASGDAAPGDAAPGDAYGGRKYRESGITKSSYSSSSDTTGAAMAAAAIMAAATAAAATAVAAAAAAGKPAATIDLPRIADCGGLMIGVPIMLPYTPPAAAAAAAAPTAATAVAARPAAAAAVAAGVAAAAATAATAAAAARQRVSEEAQIITPQTASYLRVERVLGVFYCFDLGPCLGIAIPDDGNEEARGRCHSYADIHATAVNDLLPIDHCSGYGYFLPALTMGKAWRASEEATIKAETKPENDE
ncbi:hypothetical protein ACSSS7_002878 [Eimeria intestinalis]